MVHYLYSLNVLCTQKLQFFGIFHCCTPDFFPVCQSVFGMFMFSLSRLFFCALSTVLVGSSAMHRCIVCVFGVMSTSIFSTFCTSTMLLVGSSFFVCKVCVHCHVNINLQCFLCVNLCCLLVLHSLSAKCVFVVMSTSIFSAFCASTVLVGSSSAMFGVMSTLIFSAFCTSTMLLVGSSFLVCKVCVHCHVNSTSSQSE